jgi:hypothetical protein
MSKWHAKIGKVWIGKEESTLLSQMEDLPKVKIIKK